MQTKINLENEKILPQDSNKHDSTTVNEQSINMWENINQQGSSYVVYVCTSYAKMKRYDELKKDP